MDYIPVKTLCGNHLRLCATVVKHNLTRGLQMETRKPSHGLTEKRAPLCMFQEAEMIRRHLIYRTGSLTKPQGKSKLGMSGNDVARKSFRFYLDALRSCAEQS
jgi:hypothetical protein